MITKTINILKCEAKPDYAWKIKLVQYHSLHFHKLDLILPNNVLLVHYLQR